MCVGLELRRLPGGPGPGGGRAEEPPGAAAHPRLRDSGGTGHGVAELRSVKEGRYRVDSKVDIIHLVSA